jgi:hypothetical protein
MANKKYPSQFKFFVLAYYKSGSSRVLYAGDHLKEAIETFDNKLPAKNIETLYFYQDGKILIDSRVIPFGYILHSTSQYNEPVSTYVKYTCDIAESVDVQLFCSATNLYLECLNTIEEEKKYKDAATSKEEITPAETPAAATQEQPQEKDSYKININKNTVYTDDDFDRVMFHFTELKKQTSGHILLIKNGLVIRERKPILQEQDYKQFLDDTVDNAEYNAYLDHIHTPRASEY